MRKLFWLHSHFLFNAGATRFVYEVALRLSKKYEIVMVVEKASPTWKKLYAKSNITVLEISPFSSNSLLYWAFFPIFILNNWLALRKIIRKDDIVITSMFPMNFLGALVSKKTVNYCFEPFAFFHDKRLQESFPSYKRVFLKILSKMYGQLDVWGTKASNKIVAINPSVGTFITQLYQRNIDGYTYLGIDHSVFHTEHKSLITKKKNETILFHSTDYTPLKGTEYLLRGLSLLDDFSHLRVYISESIENKKIKSSYKKIISNAGLENTIFFIGHIPYNDLPKMYAAADIYCFTGDPLSLGASAASLSVLEAQACGVPVIRSVGNTDEVIHGKTGLLVDPRNSQDLAKAIRQLVDNKKLRERMGKAASVRVKKQYTWDKVADRLETLLKKL